MGDERVFEDGRKRYKTFVDEYEINISNPELMTFSKKIDKLTNSWYGEIESTNSVIIGDSPISRVNDARIKKLIANTQTVMAKYAGEISGIMIELDRIATEKYDTDEELPEIIKLIAECFSVLHMEYLLKFKYSENNVKYEIGQSIRNIYVKWNKKFKTLPTKQLLDIEIEIKETKQKLKEAQKQEKDTIKKIESYSSQAVEESSVQLQESIDKNSTTIEELLRKNEELEVQITSIENGINEKKTEKDRLEGEIKNLKTEQKNEIKQCTIEQQSISDELERLAEQKKNLENERFNLKRNEDFERSKAGSALFFKKKHLALADSIASNIAEVDTRIESLNKQIEVNNLKDNDLKKKISDLEVALENDVTEKNHLIEEIKRLIDDEKDKKSILSNEKRSNLEIIKNKQADNKQNQKAIKDNNRIVKDNNNEIKWLNEVLDDAKAKTAKLEEKKNALEEEKNELKERIKQQNKANKEKEQQDKQQVIETNNDKTTVNDSLLEKTPLKDNTVEHNMVDVKEDASQRKGIEGLKFVVTGDIEAFPYRDDLQFFIEEHGAKLTSSVSKNTDYLITNTPDSGTVKNKKARELGVKIINEEQFFAMVGENNNVDDISAETANDGKSVAVDQESIINELKKRYEDKDKPLSINQCIEENPDIEDKIRALQSQASVLFGMPLTQYFIQIDLVKNQKERYIRRYKYRDLAEAGEDKDEVNYAAEESVAEPIQISEEKETAQIQTAKENETKQMQAVDVSEEEQNQGIEEIDENTTSDSDIMEMKEETVIKNESNQNRPYISDSKLSLRVDDIFDKLEALYPEHKIFALDSLADTLRERLSKLYKELGYESVDELLAVYGFEKISIEETKKLRDRVIYEPGNEPDIIRNKVASMLDRLEEYYPEHKIPEAISNKHTNLAGDISGIYQWLGYPDAATMLKAYGFVCDFNLKGGRKKTFDPEAIIEELRRRYEGKEKPSSISIYADENPDLAGNIKTLQNASNNMFGMSLAKYFEQIGMIDKSGGKKTKNVSSEMVDYVINELSERYNNKKRVYSLSELVAQNDDISKQIKELKKNEIEIFGKQLAEVLEEKYIIINPSLYGLSRTQIDKILDCCLIESKVVKDSVFDTLRHLSIRKNTGGDYLVKNRDFKMNSLIIPSGLDIIEEYGFCDNNSIEYLEIQEGIMYIGKEAFKNCKRLTKVVLPKSLRLIDKSAFSQCSELEEVIFNNEATYVDEDVFQGCKYKYKKPDIEINELINQNNFEWIIKNNQAIITKYIGNDTILVIPEKINDVDVKEIAEGAFGIKRADSGHAEFVRELYMPDSIEKVECDFRFCSLKKVRLSNSLNRIPFYCVDEFNVPDNVRSLVKDGIYEYIGNHGSLGRFISSKKVYIGKEMKKKKLTELFDTLVKDHLYEPGPVFVFDKDHPDYTSNGRMIISKPDMTVEYYLDERNSLFHTSDMPGRELVIPEGVKHIKESAFANARIKSVSFPNSLETIGEKAFYSIDCLTEIKLNDGLTEIGNGAFEETGIIGVKIPGTVKRIGKEAFLRCGSKEKVGRKSSLSKILDDDFSVELKIDYRFDVELSEGLEEIEDRAFAYCQGLKMINLPDSLKDIGERAFWGTRIKLFEIGTNVQKIGACAFDTGSINIRQCNSFFDSVKFKHSHSDIIVNTDNDVFYTDNNMLIKKRNEGDIIIFYFGKGRSVVIPDGVTEIDDNAFMFEKNSVDIGQAKKLKNVKLNKNSFNPDGLFEEYGRFSYRWD